MRNQILVLVGTILLVCVPVHSQSGKISIGYVDNADGKYSECGKKLSFLGSEKHAYIFVYANDATEMKIDGRAVQLTLESTTEKPNGSAEIGDTFRETYRANDMKIVIRYRLNGDSDNTIQYVGTLLVKRGKLKAIVKFEGISGC
ncbi:MAG: hypothetical protein KDB79_07920 [Acidobacteria bacterium]|nr:hypothetical protein [Acidobacteriota bacterium]